MSVAHSAHGWDSIHFSRFKTYRYIKLLANLMSDWLAKSERRYV